MSKRNPSNAKQKLLALRIITHVGALLPLLILIWEWWSWNYLYWADPIREVTLRTGKTAIILLVLSLACTPLNIVFGWSQLVALRKPLGLYSFLYVSLHLLVFVYLDYGLELSLISEAILEKRYALVGFIAFLILLALAATSTKWAMKKLGKRWKTLHKGAYLAAILAVVHYFWLVKNAYAQPILFATILAILFAIRWQPIKAKLSEWRKARKRKVSSARA